MEEVMTRLMLLCAWLCAMNFTPSANAQLFVTNSIISNNGNSGSFTGTIGQQ
jgi:hypothetical protein